MSGRSRSEDVLQRPDRKLDDFPWNKHERLPSEECDRLRKVTWQGARYLEIKKPWEERHSPCVSFREALRPPRLSRPISHEALVAVTKAYSGLTAASRSPRKLLGRHSTATHLTSMRRVLTHTYASAYVRRFATEYTGDRKIERSLGTRILHQCNVIGRLNILYVLSGIFRSNRKILDRYCLVRLYGILLGERRLLLFNRKFELRKNFSKLKLRFETLLNLIKLQRHNAIDMITDLWGAIFIYHDESGNKTRVRH